MPHIPSLRRVGALFAGAVLCAGLLTGCRTVPASSASSALSPDWTAAPAQGTAFRMVGFTQDDGGGLLYTRAEQFPDAAVLDAALHDWTARQTAADAQTARPSPLPTPSLLWALPADYDGNGTTETFFAVGVSNLDYSQLWDSVSIYLHSGDAAHWVRDANCTLQLRLLQYPAGAQLLLDSGYGFADAHSSVLLGWDGTAVYTAAAVQSASFAQAGGILYADARYGSVLQTVPTAAFWDSDSGRYVGIPWQPMPLDAAKQLLPWTGWRTDPPGTLQHAALLNDTWVLAIYAPAEGSTETTVRIAMRGADGVWQAYTDWTAAAAPDEVQQALLSLSWQSIQTDAAPQPTPQPTDPPLAEPAAWVDEPGGPTYRDGAALVQYTFGAAGAPALPPQLTARPDTLPLKVPVWVSARPGGHSLQSFADKLGVSVEEFCRMNPDLTDKGLASAYRNGGSANLVVDDAFPLPWDTPTRTVTITMPVEGDAALWEQRGAPLARSYELPADLPEAAAQALAEGYWYLNNRLHGPGEPLGDNPLVYAAADGSRFVTWHGLCRYLEQTFTPELTTQLADGGWCAENGRLCVQDGDKGTDLEYLATLFTPPVTLPDGSIEFYQIALRGDAEDIHWSARLLQPTHIARSRVLLQKTDDGYRVAQLQLMY